MLAALISRIAGFGFRNLDREAGQGVGVAFLLGWAEAFGALAKGGQVVGQGDAQVGRPQFVIGPLYLVQHRDVGGVGGAPVGLDRHHRLLGAVGQRLVVGRVGHKRFHLDPQRGQGQRLALHQQFVFRVDQDDLVTLKVLN